MKKKKIKENWIKVKIKDIQKDKSNCLARQKIYCIAAIIVIIDQVIKLWVKTKMILLQEIIVIPNFFSLYYIENEGAAFSLLKNQTFFLILVSMICLFFIDQYIRKEAMIDSKIQGLVGVIMGGIFGNLIDRILYYRVVDYLSFTFFQYHFAVFNFADIAITLGILFLILYVFIYGKENRKHNRKS